MCDLDVRIEGTDLQQRIDIVDAQLKERGLICPQYWISDEWFSPDGVPGVAVPFYLLHPRLAKLELSLMLEVEGGDEETCLKILRHEAGHAIDNAYQLRRRRARRDVFGRPGETHRDRVSGFCPRVAAVERELEWLRARPTRAMFRMS